MGGGTGTSGLEKKAFLRLKSETQKLEFELGGKPAYTIGREKECDIQLGQLLLGGEVSRKHAEITRSEDWVYQIKDLGSKNGTYVGKEKIGDSYHSLKNGDKITFGKHISFEFIQGLN